jgi:hypothetical protein
MQANEYMQDDKDEHMDNQDYNNYLRSLMEPLPKKEGDIDFDDSEFTKEYDEWLDMVNGQGPDPVPDSTR